MYHSAIAAPQAQEAPKAKGKVVAFYSKVKSKASQVFNWMACAGTMALCSVNTYATIGGLSGNDYKIGDVSNFDPENMILSLAFWLCRLIGISMLIFGIYGYVTARKDGEAEAMNGAIGKLISGVVLIAMPSILKSLGILG